MEQAVKKGVTIRFSNDENGYFDPNYNHIVWNPKFSVSVYNGLDTGYVSPALVLLHEVVHSVDTQARIKYIPSDGTKPYCLPSEICEKTKDENLLKMHTNREKLAVETERQIGQQLGEPTRLFYTDVIGTTLAVSPLDSNRKYYQNGQYHESEFRGHNKDSSGSIYTQKTIAFDNDLPTKKPLKVEIIKHSEDFKTISKSIAIHDYKQGIITTTITDYQNIDENNKPKVSQNITTLDGKPIQLNDKGKTPTPMENEDEAVISVISPKHQQFVQQCEDKLIALCNEKHITADHPQDFKNIAAALAAKGIVEQGMTKIDKIAIENSNIFILSYEPQAKFTSVNAHEVVNIPTHESFAKIQQSEQKIAQQTQEYQISQQQAQGRHMV